MNLTAPRSPSPLQSQALGPLSLLQKTGSFLRLAAFSSVLAISLHRGVSLSCESKNID